MPTATLPASWYGDATIHERERAVIFGSEWLYFTTAAAFAGHGDYVAGEIAGWHIVVVQGEDGALLAHHNVCRHRAGPLVEDGTGHASSFVCRYHGWAYALDGALRSARDFGPFDCDGITLVPAEVDVWRGLVFVRVVPGGPPLLESLGSFIDACAPYPIESFVPVAERVHELECNWKTYADNYLEGYHIPLVHPGLNKEIDARRYRVDVDERDRWVQHSAPARAGAVNLGRWLWRWPNLALNLYPSAMNIERFDPVAPRRTRLRYTYAFAPDVVAEDRGDVVRVSSSVTAEDVAICEAVQRNLDSGVYDEGWLSPRHEEGLKAFQRWVRTAISPGASSPSRS
jgi:choline monooxygenase